MHSVLAINSGSSTLRFALFKVGELLPQILMLEEPRRISSFAPNHHGDK